MGVRSAIALAVVATALLDMGVAQARAASVTVDHPCYYSEGTARQLIVFQGQGFAPSSTVRLMSGGQEIGEAPLSAAGTFVRAIRAPRLTANSHYFPVNATDGTSSSTVNYHVSRVRASFFPSAGRPSTLRVSFVVRGLGAVLAAQGRRSSVPVYLHWLAPTGKLRLTKRLGTLGGPCGSLVTARQRVLPFMYRTGTYRMLFDPRHSYSRKTFPQVGVRFRVTQTFF